MQLKILRIADDDYLLDIEPEATAMSLYKQQWACISDIGLV